MSLGRVVRILLGPLFPAVGRVYRRLFVDLDEVAAAFPTLRPGSTVLDVGGGDGAVIDRVLARQPSLYVVMFDIAPRIGFMIHPSRRDRVRCFPSTPVSAFSAIQDIPIDIAIVSDVLHHVPAHKRLALLQDVMSAFGVRPRCLVVKDVEPTGWLATLGLFSDRYISGDRGTSLLRQDEVVRLVHEIDPALTVHHTDLFSRDAPNYAIVFGDVPR
jgi:hypothetical protein